MKPSLIAQRVLLLVVVVTCGDLTYGQSRAPLNFYRRPGANDGGLTEREKEVLGATEEGDFVELEMLMATMSPSTKTWKDSVSHHKSIFDGARSGAMQEYGVLSDEYREAEARIAEIEFLSLVRVYYAACFRDEPSLTRDTRDNVHMADCLLRCLDEKLGPDMQPFEGTKDTWKKAFNNVHSVVQKVIAHLGGATDGSINIYREGYRAPLTLRDAASLAAVSGRFDQAVKIQLRYLHTWHPVKITQPSAIDPWATLNEKEEDAWLQYAAFSRGLTSERNTLAERVEYARKRESHFAALLRAVCNPESTDLDAAYADGLAALPSLQYDCTYHYLMGRLAEELRKYGKASFHYRQATDLHPQYVSPLEGMASVHAAMLADPDYPNLPDKRTLAQKADDALRKSEYRSLAVAKRRAREKRDKDRVHALDRAAFLIREFGDTIFTRPGYLAFRGHFHEVHKARLDKGLRE